MEPSGWPTSERASFGTRFLAALIDGIIVAVAGGLLRLFGIPFFGLLLSLGYFTYFEGESGQTIGKKAMNIRVADLATGTQIGYGRAAVRWLGRFVSGIAIGLGYLWMLWDAEAQTWHDKMAQSIVVPAAAMP
jgi:uncharacterized RDD family membrane protein YckC